MLILYLASYSSYLQIKPSPYAPFSFPSLSLMLLLLVSVKFPCGHPSNECSFPFSSSFFYLFIYFFGLLEKGKVRRETELWEPDLGIGWPANSGGWWWRVIDNHRPPLLSSTDIRPICTKDKSCH